MPAIVKPHSISWTEVLKRTWKKLTKMMYSAVPRS